MKTFSTEELKTELKMAGIQPSAPRLAIADYVLQTQDHPTAERVREEVEKRMPSVSLATIYNTLHLFVEKGLLRSVRDPNSDLLHFDCNTKPHFHFYDEDTGQMIDLDADALRISPNFKKLHQNFDISEIEVTVKGKMKPKELT